jgi:hypothetical protein
MNARRDNCRPTEAPCSEDELQALESGIVCIIMCLPVDHNEDTVRRLYRTGKPFIQPFSFHTFPVTHAYGWSSIPFYRTYGGASDFSQPLSGYL